MRSLPVSRMSPLISLSEVSKHYDSAAGPIVANEGRTGKVTYGKRRTWFPEWAH